MYNFFFFFYWAIRVHKTIFTKKIKTNTSTYPFQVWRVMLETYELIIVKSKKRMGVIFKSLKYFLPDVQKGFLSKTWEFIFFFYTYYYYFLFFTTRTCDQLCFGPHKKQFESNTRLINLFRERMKLLLKIHRTQFSMLEYKYVKTECFFFFCVFDV